MTSEMPQFRKFSGTKKRINNNLTNPINFIKKLDKVDSSIINFDNIKISIEDNSVDSLEKTPERLKYGSPALWLKRRSARISRQSEKKLFNLNKEKSPILPKINLVKLKSLDKKSSMDKVEIPTSINNKNKFSNIRLHDITLSKNEDEIYEETNNSIKNFEYETINTNPSKPKLGDIKVYKLRSDIINSQQNSSSGSNEKNGSLFNTINVNNDPFLHKISGDKIKWKSGEIIAEGSTSVVYKALNVENGSIFVVKRFHSIDEKQLLCFQNEVKIFLKLNHDNIVKYIDSEIINKSLFIYLEYIPGGSIKYLLNKYGTLNENLIRLYLKQILNALEFLHKNGIVHRDIKSANILVDLNGNIKLSDFGCSGLNLGDSDQFSSLKGTIPWMAPEVIRQNKYGKKADIWSLGCTVLEMATGEIPWGKMENYVQALFKIGRSDDIPNIPKSVKKELRDFILCCFKRDPRERPTVEILKNHSFLKE